MDGSIAQHDCAIRPRSRPHSLRSNVAVLLRSIPCLAKNRTADARRSDPVLKRGLLGLVPLNLSDRLESLPSLGCVRSLPLRALSWPDSQNSSGGVAAVQDQAEGSRTLAMIFSYVLSDS